MEIDDKLLLDKAINFGLKNAEQFHKDADLLIAIGSYSHAFALAIMSDEEFGKAVMYHLCSLGLLDANVLPKPLNSYLKDKMYGELANQTWTMGVAIASNLEEMIEHIMARSSKITSHAGLNQNSKEVEMRYKQVFTDLESKVINKIGRHLKILNALKDEKEKNFYVTFHSQTKELIFPNLIGKKQVETYLAETKYRLRNYRPFFSIKLTPSETKTVKIQISKLIGKAPNVSS